MSGESARPRSSTISGDGSSELDDPNYEFFPVYVDLQGTPESQFFATLAEDVFHELEPLLGGLQPGEGLDPDADYGYRELVADLRRVLKVLEKRTSKQVKLVLLIDEVDELNAYDPRINQRLRSLFMKSFAENLVAVVSGVEIRKQWDKEGSPWYNFFEEIEVTPIGRDDAVQLITRPDRRRLQDRPGGGRPHHRAHRPQAVPRPAALYRARQPHVRTGNAGRSPSPTSKPSPGTMRERRARQSLRRRPVGAR